MRAASDGVLHRGFPAQSARQKQSKILFHKIKQSRNHFKFKFSFCPAKTFILMRAVPDGVLIKFLIRGVSGDLRGGLRMI